MSSSESIQQQKRKHGEVADQVINGLEGYSELTPKSQKLRDDLLKTAKRIRDLEDADDQLLGSAFELFEAKQKQAKEIKEIKEEREVIVEQVAKLTGQLESIQAELDDSRSKEIAAERTVDDYRFLFRYGDWLAIKLTALAGKEEAIRDEEFTEFEAMYVALNKVNKAEAEEKAKKEAKERGEPFRGPVKYKKIKAQDQAKADARWKAHDGRQVTSLHTRVQVERKAVENWLEANDEAIPPPQTPFLDRIEKMSKQAGIERWLYLQWIKEYSDRNEICHSRPPVAKNYRKTIEKDGKVVVVEPDKKSPEDAVDWESMRAAIEVAKADVETRFKGGILGRERRDCYIELMDAYWTSLFGEDEDEPTLTELAKKQAKALLEGTAKPPASPPREYRREYKKGKWDDIYKARD
ncbi:uncharacterized protein NECHADRAFT_86745 [Fusarium vanettenii 77-13-4]|uniref:Uncharacterized protein n=1 Tax=Fusarium vanettenii (strain ATCC MYA-4622 / CBS 123669 / FGSC 9596 / NRRL 45880 / 77-13-4) TaxID=660122 RepID=C7ZFW1_FUSV7|nr:uncharacterized protein NECHADRAFT_86745 [Fusarium vanettenii 77-13-4]EEU37127.1 predicted protein [Fusarium vanettenii 77-13-4]